MKNCGFSGSDLTFCVPLDSECPIRDFLITSTIEPEGYETKLIPGVTSNLSKIDLKKIVHLSFITQELRVNIHLLKLQSKKMVFV